MKTKSETIKESLLKLPEVSDVIVSDSMCFNTYEVLILLNAGVNVTAVWLAVIAKKYKVFYFEIEPGNNNQLTIKLYVHG